MEQKNSNDKLRDILTKIKGIKNVKIIICILAVAVALLIYGSVVPGKSGSATKKVTTDEIKNITYSDNEEKLADIIGQIDGIGKTKVMISYGENEKINGVIVVAEGAEKPLNEWKIRHAVQTALKIDYHSVEVYSMKDNK